MSFLKGCQWWPFFYDYTSCPSEQHINETILKRGLSYYKKGAVQDINEQQTGNYTAYVNGSELYEVEVDIKNGVIETLYCDCPYDGDVCKHAVAVLFELQADTIQLNDEQIQKTTKTKKAKVAKEKTPKEQLQFLLLKLEKEELIKSILEIAGRNKTIIYQLLNKYSNLVQEPTQIFYTNQIKNIGVPQRVMTNTSATRRCACWFGQWKICWN